MTTLSPKENFQQFQKPIADQVQMHRESSWLTVGFTYAVAELAYSGATAERIAGARAFIEIFQNLWEPSPKGVSLPQKTLTSFEVPPEQLQHTATEAAKKAKP
jgi:hypothetical protein